VVPANFSLSGPGPSAVTGVSLAGTTVTLTIAPAADGAAGVWTVRATSNVRDLAGNKIAGDWGPLAADYLGAFGATGAAGSLVCTAFDPPGLAFVPDGDPGYGVEADVVTIGVSSPTVPAWWVVEVRDAGDALVSMTRAVPAAADDEVVWAARDLRGLVVPNGTWRVTTWPDDGLGNRGTGCEATVSVANPIGWAGP
jgi:hypothetical protein